MNYLCTICLVLVSSINLFAEYQGVVFIDENANGTFDDGERGLSGIVVSDGFNVTKTDEDGAFSLPGFDNQRFIFITTPSGFINQNAHYISIKERGTGYDFGLIPYSERVEEDGTHKFIHITDSEISKVEGNEKWANMIRDYAINEKAAFIIHTGDICYESGLKSHIRLMNTAKLGTQMYYCIGNHDLVEGEYGEELFESLYGPVYYSFDVGNTHYIVTPMESGDYPPSYTKEQVYKWLKNDLELVPKEKSIVVFNHDILTYGDEFVFGIDDEERINLNDYNLKAWIYGHWHINHIKDHNDVLSICTSSPNMGGIDHSTSVFRVVHVDSSSNIFSELRYNYIDEKITINSIVKNQVPIRFDGKVPLSVNVYKTISPVARVRYWISQLEEIVSQDEMIRQTDWNWSKNVKIPQKYDGTSLMLKVEAKCNDGSILYDEVPFVYESNIKKEIVFKENWTNLLKNAQHMGIVKDEKELSLEIGWINNIGANIFMSSPLIYNGNVFVASVDENKRGEAGVFALDGQNGQIKWTYRTRGSIKNSIAAGEGVIFAQDAEGFLYAIDAEEGRLVWEKKMNVDGLPAVTEGITVDNGKVFAGSGKGFSAIDIKTGEIQWTNVDWDQNQGGTNTIAVNDKVAIHGTQWGALYSNDINTGKMLWSNHQHGLHYRGSSPAIHDDVLYLISGASIFLIESRNGKVLFRKELSSDVDVTSTPLVTDNEIVFGTVYDGIIALDKETFKTKWKFKTGEALTYTSPYSSSPASTVETSPVFWRNTIFVGASDGGLYGLDPTDGSLKWSHNLGTPVFSSVAISGNTMVVSDLSGNVYLFVGKE